MTSEELALYCKNLGVTIPTRPGYEYDPATLVVDPLPDWLLKIDAVLEVFFNGIIQCIRYGGHLWEADSYGFLFGL